MLLLVIGGLALLDSTAFGTLLIPVWLTMAPGQFRFGRIATYLAVVALSYYAIGLALLLGADALFARYRSVFESEGFSWILVFIGALAVMIGVFLMWRDRRRNRVRKAPKRGPGVLRRIRDHIMQSESSGLKSASLMTSLALTAVVLEVATMLPYLAAIGILVAQELSLWQSASLLALYCVVMIMPALLLALGRCFFPKTVSGPLTTLDELLSEQATSSSAGFTAIFGVVIAGIGIFELL
ncbi:MULTISPECIES: GAP family protein [Auritidibacter]|uniref:GAP family protein n=1 Tax=Auritidibacter ignavus TaxID=678932 RepID=A0AAJ6DDG2_9MICC|nr:MULTISPECIES: GAP family protein [Auritidibacter]AXR73848.1 hypothetical protein DCC27_005525 [Auritidibacter sp. NML130574]NIH72195.1 hypothetical protein [Auritidibacter ignavus]PXA77198.1 hypothetical protein DCC24_04475 [Auritidibacter sp. NML100628]PXA78903.1 hypothetical protein DCC25_10735 [Auritidibacter sp. NML120636]RMX23786.1 hypothetical protein DYI20_02930 [Auritidibacter ignavus]